MKKIIIWLAKVFHVELPKAEVIKEFPYPVYESGSKEFENLLESSNWNSNNE